MKRFIPEYMELKENTVGVDEDSNGNVVVIRPNANHLIINQDEKIHHSNDV